MQMGFADVVETESCLHAYDFIIANTGAPGKSVDVVFSDWGMKGISGFDLLKKVRQSDLCRDIIFVMLVDEQGASQIIEAVRAGVDECVVKPFSSLIVRDKLEQIMLHKLADIRKEVDAYLYKVDLTIETPESSISQKKRVDIFGSQILKIAEIAPWSHRAYLDLGNMYFKFRMFADAEKMARKVLSIEFGSAEAHQLLSLVLKAMGKIPQSIKELEIALAGMPSSGELKLKLGDAYLKEGRYTEAINLLSQAAKAYSLRRDKVMEAKGRNSLGQAKFEKGEADNDNAMIEDGVKELNTATSLDPGLIAAYYNLVVAYQKTGHAAEALKVFEKIQSVEPKDADGWVDMGKTYLMRHEPEKAHFAFKKADQLAGGKVEIYEEAATALYRHKYYKEALVYLAKAKEANPSDKYIYNLSGVIYRILGDRFAAVDEYKKAANLDPNDAAIIFNLGVAYFKTSQEDLSLTYFRKAKTLDPHLVEADKYLEILEAGKE